MAKRVAGRKKHHGKMQRAWGEGKKRRGGSVMRSSRWV